MSDTTLPFLQNPFPPSGEREPYDAHRHDKFAATAPPELAAEWRNFGFGAYGNGLLWTVPPDRRVLNPRDWRGVKDKSIEIVRSAFGHVALWQNGNLFWTDPYTGLSDSFNSDLKVFFWLVEEPNFRKNYLMEPLFLTAVERFGPLTEDECYGFAPLPSLGGAISKKYLIKTEMRPYLVLAAQAK